ncbi:MAG: TraB/GumN family protein [Oscillospiraceae bacterium]
MYRRIKRLICAAAAGCMVLTAGCSAKPTEIHPPFFEVTDPETGGVVYMLGSMHSCPDNIVYPDEILSAFDSSDIIACELDTVAFSADAARRSKALDILCCPEGTTAADLMGESYGRIREFFQKNGIYSPVYEDYLPFMWTSALSNKLAADCGYSSGNGTETVMLNRAKKLGKTIFEIESAEQQYEMSASMPLPLQLYTLEQAADTDYSEQTAQAVSLYEAWSSFDPDAFEALIEEDIPPELSEEYAEYYAAMYTDRQRVMADYVISELENGSKVFMLVGAMHYYAEPDIITLLEQAGYTVSEIRTDAARNAA